MTATKRYLVTGGAGFIGSALVRRLLEDGHQVVILDDFSRGRLERVPIEVGYGHVYSGDIRDPSIVQRAAVGCDAVVHMAYVQGTQTFYEEPRRVLDVATLGMSNVLEACRMAAIPELMFISSSEAYQLAGTVPTPETVPLVIPDITNPRYSYGIGKILGEAMSMAWQRSGILERVQIVRPHNIIGPDMGWEHVVPEFCKRMNSLPRGGDPQPFPIQGTGYETRSFCYITDCITQIRLIQQTSAHAEIYHIGNEDERTINDLAHEVAKCYGREIKVEPGQLPKGSPLRRRPDTSKVRALGFSDPVPFEQAIRLTVEWYQNHAG